MASSRVARSVLERVVVALAGILSLVLLDLPFWQASIGSYGWINLSSGLQLALEGANPNLANLILVTYPSAYYSSQYLLTYGSITMPVVIFAWWIILGSILVEFSGFTAILFTHGEKARRFGRLIALGGKFVFVGGFLTVAQVVYHLSQFSSRYNPTMYGIAFYPSFALLIEPLLGIVMWVLGSKIRHAPEQPTSTRM